MNPLAVAPRRWLRGAVDASLLLLQFALLFALDALGSALAHALGWPLPSGVIGMVLLLALLGSGVLPLAVVGAAAGVVARHLPLLFVPIAVGLVEHTALFAEHGIVLAAVIATSAACAMAAGGACYQRLACEPRRAPQ